MAREALVVLLVLMVSFAGCLQGEDPLAAAAQENDAAEGRIAEELGAVPVRENVSLARASNASSNETVEAEPWWLATAQILPEGGLGAFWWTVPEGALVRDDVFESGDGDSETVVLEIAPILTDGAEVTAWGFVAFREDDDGLLEAGGGHLEYTAEVTLPAGYDLEQPAVPEVEPVFLTLGRDLEVGDRLAFLVIAVGETPGELGVAFRVMSHDPRFMESEEEAASDVAAFLAARGAEPPMQVETREAKGFVMNAYAEFSTMLFGPFTMTMQVGDVGREDIGGPFSPARSLRLWTSTGTTGGWGVAGADFFALGMGATRWEAAAAARDVTVDGEGVEVDAVPTLFTPGPLLYGNGGAFAIGEGDGDVAAELDLKRVGSPGLVFVVDVVNIAIGATLEHLFGVPGAELAAAAEGLPLKASFDPERAEVVREHVHGGTLTWRPLGWQPIELDLA